MNSTEKKKLHWQEDDDNANIEKGMGEEAEDINMLDDGNKDW